MSAAKQNEKLNDASAESVDSSQHPPSSNRRKRKRRYVKLYCGGCWRVEKHYALNRNLVLVLAYSILTCGLYLAFRRFKCRICGRKRTGIG